MNEPTSPAVPPEGDREGSELEFSSGPDFSTGGFEAPAPAELSELMAGYEVSALIARGGMGAVYQARQTSLDRGVAIKILPREFGADGQFRRSFESEARAMAQLNHPNLISVHDFGEVDGFLFIIMELVKGTSLFHVAHGKAIEQGEVARLVHGICDGLGHAHDAGIIHRDIKPANILLDSRRRPKIGDFGLARSIDSTERADLNFATPDYAAPEVMKNTENADKRSDVFSIGVILHELLTGELPGEDYRPASRIVEVDPRFDKLLRRALHPAPALRFADANEMAKELETLKDSLEKPTTRFFESASPRNQGGLESRAAVKDSAPPAPAPAPGRASITPYLAILRNLAIIAGLLAAIVLVWDAYHRRKEQILKEVAKQEEDARIREAQPPDDPTSRHLVAPPPVNGKGDPRGKTPLYLSVLKNSLARGNRDRFPYETQKWGDSRIFLVEKPASWPDACAFAVAHGGHLATLASEAEKTSILSLLPTGSDVWLGGGSTGSASWGWVDGGACSFPGNPSATTGYCLSLASDGTLRAEPHGKKHPFFIQWHMSGENPGALDAQLKRTKASLGQAKPAYPPGTISRGDHHYLIASPGVTWNQAQDLAHGAGGHLAVPSDKSENEFLRETLARILPEDSAAWLGGSYRKGAWSWTTGENWVFTAWIPHPANRIETDLTALCMVTLESGAGWDNADPSDHDLVSAFVIEWSKTQRVVRKELPATVFKLAELQNGTSTEVDNGRAQYAKMILQNGTNMNRALQTWYNGLDRRIRGTYFSPVQRAQKTVQKSGRIDEKR